MLPRPGTPLRRVLVGYLELLGLELGLGSMLLQLLQQVVRDAGQQRTLSRRLCRLYAIILHHTLSLIT